MFRNLFLRSLLDQVTMFFSQDLVRLVAADEPFADGCAAIRGVQHDLHGSLHAAYERDLQSPFAVRTSDCAHRGLDSLLQLRLELLARAFRRFVSTAKTIAVKQSSR